MRARLLVVLGLLLGVVVVPGAVALWTTRAYQEALAEVRDEANEAGHATLLGRIARDEYVQRVHYALVRDPSHERELNELSSRFIDDAAALRRTLARGDVAELDKMLFCHRQIGEAVEREIVPAAAARDEVALHRAQHWAHFLLADMTKASDALVTSSSARMNAAAVRAERSAQTQRLGLLAAALMALALGVAAMRLLVRDVVLPLRAIGAVASRVRAGELRARATPPTVPELREVAVAMNEMLDGLAAAESRVAAQERLAALGRVAAGVAHEINNPLAVIRGYVRTFLDDEPDGAIADELRIVDDEAATCQRIVEDLLASARTPRLVVEAIEARALLEDCVARQRERDDRGCVYALQAEADTISLDPDRIRQVLANLLRNAAEASGPGGQVTVRGARLGDRYCISVRDRGPGVPAELRATILEPFFTTKQNGTGLGLSVSNGIVAAHGGVLRVESDEGGGACFVVELPRAAGDPAGHSSRFW